MLMEELAERVFTADRAFYREAALHESDVFESDRVSALFAGQDSPLTQAVGAFESEDLDQLNAFYSGRSSWYEAIAMPCSGSEAVAAILRQGGVPMGWEDLLWRETSVQPTPMADVREIGPDEFPRWEAIGRRVFFGENPPAFAAELDALRRRMRGTRRYMAYVEDQPVAVASMGVRAGLAFLGGGATLPEFRSRGLQSALIERRLSDASSLAHVAVVGCGPGSTSHRNAERAGFRVAWSQLSFRIPVR